MKKHKYNIYWLVILLLLSSVPVFGQMGIEYPLFFSALGREGAFFISNQYNSHIIFYVDGTQIQEAQSSGKFVIKNHDVLMEVVIANINDFMKDDKKKKTEKQVLQTYHKWEMDYQKKNTKQFKILKSKSTEFGKHTCFITQYTHANDYLDSLLTVSVVANKSVVVFTFPLFKEGKTSYRTVSYKEALEYAEKIVKPMMILDKPVPYHTLKLLIDEEDIFRTMINSKKGKKN
ncbi:MAG: hypothetical protein JW969_05680 [Spirochaetales bacterium]|nr:hypothetical protein [Spirochaetales bacterium]